MDDKLVDSPQTMTPPQPSADYTVGLTEVTTATIIVDDPPDYPTVDVTRPRVHRFGTSGDAWLVEVGRDQRGNGGDGIPSPDRVASSAGATRSESHTTDPDPYPDPDPPTDITDIDSVVVGDENGDVVVAGPVVGVETNHATRTIRYTVFGETVGGGSGSASQSQSQSSNANRPSGVPNLGSNPDPTPSPNTNWVYGSNLVESDSDRDRDRDRDRDPDLEFELDQDHDTDVGRAKDYTIKANHLTDDVYGLTKMEAVQSLVTRLEEIGVIERASGER